MCTLTGTHVCLNWHETWYLFWYDFVPSPGNVRLGHVDETDERIRSIRVVTPLLMHGLIEHVTQRRSSVREAERVALGNS
jgi:hypothetical protein